MDTLDWKDVKAGDWVKASLKRGAGILQGVVTRINHELMGSTFDINDAVDKSTDNWELREHRPIEPS